MERVRTSSIPYGTVPLAPRRVLVGRLDLDAADEAAGKAAMMSMDGHKSAPADGMNDVRPAGEAGIRLCGFI